MTIRKIEIERFSITTSKPFKMVVAALKETIKRPDIIEITKSLQTNPIIIQKTLKLLEREGLVALRQGRHSSISLRHPASCITLSQIYKAVESESRVFAMRGQVHEQCVIACAMKRRLGPIFNAAN